MGQRKREASGPGKPPASTQFKPGNNANPNGRPKGIVQQIREVTQDGKIIIDTVMEILQDPKTGKKDKLEATKWLKEHGFGKAPDISLTGSLSDAERSQAAASLADAELETLARALQSSISTTAPVQKPVQVLEMTQETH